jgi:hypothetical protein
VKKLLSTILVMASVILYASAALASTTAPLESGITGMDQYKQVRVVQGSPAWIESEVNYAVATINAQTGAHWTHGPDVPYDGSIGVSQLQLPEPAGQAWVFYPTAQTLKNNPGWPAGNWTTYQVFEGTHTVNGATRVDRSLTEVADQGNYLMLHELGHVMGLADNPVCWNSSVMGQDSSYDTFQPCDLTGIAILVHNGWGGSVPTVSIPSVPRGQVTVTPVRPPQPSSAVTTQLHHSNSDAVLEALRILNDEQR